MERGRSLTRGRSWITGVWGWGRGQSGAPHRLRGRRGNYRQTSSWGWRAEAACCACLSSRHSHAVEVKVASVDCWS